MGEINIMKRYLKNYLLDAVLLIILGLYLLLKPGNTLTLFFRLLGLMLLIVGTVKTIRFFREKKRSMQDTVALIIGAIQLIFGLWLMISPGFLIRFVPIVAGIVIVYGALISLIQAIRAKQNGVSGATLALIFSVVTLVMGVLVVLHPAGIAAIIVQFIGVSLIAEGVTILLALSR